MDGHRESPPTDFEELNAKILEIIQKHGWIHGRRCNDQFEGARVGREHPLQHAKEEIAVKGALVGFIENDVLEWKRALQSIVQKGLVCHEANARHFPAENRAEK